MSTSNINNATNTEITESQEDTDSKDNWQLASNKNQKALKNRGPKKKNDLKLTEPVTTFIKDTYNSCNVEIVRRYISEGQKCLIILRGCPGSGKTTLANQIKFNGVVVSADSYFVNDRGVYVFNPLKLTEAHIYCRTKVTEAIKNSVTPIIIDNTNLKGWEFKAYAKMGFDYDYRVELMEPNTPWRYKASMLAAKNIHAVPITKIQKLLVDFERNIDVTSLVGGYQNHLKPGNFIKNLDRYLEMSSDWNGLQTDIQHSCVSSETTVKKEEIISNQDNKSDETLAENPEKKKKEKSTSPFAQIFENQVPALDDEKINESKDLLKAMFTDVDDDILIDFLEKYNNDVNIVTNILLDSLNLSEFSRETNTCLVKEDNQELVTQQGDESESESMSSLKSLCIKEMDRQESNVRKSELEEKESEFEINRTKPFLELTTGFSVSDDKIEHVRHSNSAGNLKNSHGRDRNGTSNRKNFIPSSKSYQNNLNLTNCGNIPKITTDLKIISSSPTNSIISSEFSRSDSGYDTVNFTKEIINEDDDEPLLKLEPSHDFLSSLITLFGDSTDELELDKISNPTIELGISTAYQLYQAWKKTIQIGHFNKSLCPNKQASQIEDDEKLSKELFDQINMRDPILKQPAFFSDKGINSAQNSLRQIMAEEMAEQAKQERRSNKLVNLQTPTVDFTKVITPALNQQTKFNIKNFNKSSNITCNDEKSKEVKINYYDASSSDYLTDMDESQKNEFRFVSNKYFNMRADYFRKAGEAFQRGWGGVAQYYAEMGHEQTFNMQHSNDIASIQAFLNNNPDIKNSNTLDLHGLQVKEALNVLKQVMAEKRIELISNNGRKIKSYLFVITGFGHNSISGPRLRPNIINYLVQTGIKFKEPNIGLLKIDLLVS